MMENTQIKPEFIKYDTMTPVELVKAMDQIQKEKERLSGELKLVEEEFDFLRLNKIPHAFEENEISILKIEGVGRCNLTADLHASILVERREEAFQYLRDTGRGDLIKEAVNPSTLKSVCKDALKSGEELPDCFRTHPFSRASITRS